MNGYGGGYGRGYGGFRPPVYPGTGYKGTGKTWTVQNRVINLNPSPGNTQVSTTVFASGSSNTVQTVKNITITANAGSATTQAVFWALVYVPGGTTASTLNPAATTNQPLYQPQQYVLATGSFIADANAEPIRIFTPLARKCGSSDSIQFVCIGTNAAVYQIVGTFKYAMGQ